MARAPGRLFKVAAPQGFHRLFLMQLGWRRHLPGLFAMRFAGTYLELESGKDPASGKVAQIQHTRSSKFLQALGAFHFKQSQPGTMCGCTLQRDITDRPFFLLQCRVDEPASMIRAAIVLVLEFLPSHDGGRCCATRWSRLGPTGASRASAGKTMEAASAGIIEELMLKKRHPRSTENMRD